MIEPAELFINWKRLVAIATPPDRKLPMFRRACLDIGRHVGDEITKAAAVDGLTEMALAHSFFGRDKAEIESIVGDELEAADRERLARAHFNGNGAEPSEPPPLSFVDIAAWQDQPVPPQEWLAYRRIPVENVTLLGGDGATGKTTIGLQLCVAVTSGKEWLGSLVDRTGRALFYTAEESTKELHRRLGPILDHYELDYRDIADKFFAHCRPDADAILGMPDRFGIIRPTPAFEQLQRAVRDIRPQLVCLEAASDLFGGDENKRPQVRGFLGMLRGQLAMKYETAVVLLQHPSQAGLATGSGTSGSTQWNNSARSRLYLSTVKANGENGEPDRDLRKLEVMKANFGPRGEIIKLRWRDGVFVVEAGPSSLERMAQDKRADDIFLRLLDRFARQNQPLSPNASRNYAPAIFADHADAAGIKSADFARSMQRLLDANVIHIEESGPPSRRRSLLALGPAEPTAAEHQRGLFQ